MLPVNITSIQKISKYFRQA